MFSKIEQGLWEHVHSYSAIYIQVIFELFTPLQKKTVEWA